MPEDKLLVNSQYYPTEPKGNTVYEISPLWKSNALWPGILQPKKIARFHFVFNPNVAPDGHNIRYQNASNTMTQMTADSLPLSLNGGGLHASSFLTVNMFKA